MFTLKNSFARQIFGDRSVKRPQTSPIQRLPFEILAEIFIICSKRRIDLAPIKIASVCWLWRDIIYDTPRAWTYLCATGIGEKHVSSEQYHLFLELSYPHLLLGVAYHVRGHPKGVPMDYHEMCSLRKIERPFEYSDRLKCLSIDCSWLADEYPTIRFPNIEHLSLRTCKPTREIDMSRFPKLWYLSTSKSRENFPLVNPHEPRRPQLRHLTLGVDHGDGWPSLLVSIGRSLRTLVCSGCLTAEPGAIRKVECPQLQSLIIYHDHVYPTYIVPAELSVPRLTYLHYRSRWSPFPPNLVNNHNELALMRTSHLIQLCNYPSLHILQVDDLRAKPLLDIAIQLESDSTLCPYLYKIEVKLREISIKTLFYIYNVQKRIRNRNEKAGSNITLVVCHKWLTGTPTDTHECEVDAPCDAWWEWEY